MFLWESMRPDNIGQGKSLCILDTSFVALLCDPRRQGFRRVSGFMTAHEGRHFDGTIVSVQHVPGHWFFVAIVDGTLHIFDGLGGNRSQQVECW